MTKAAVSVCAKHEGNFNILFDLFLIKKLGGIFSLSLQVHFYFFVVAQRMSGRADQKQAPTRGGGIFGGVDPALVNTPFLFSVFVKSEFNKIFKDNL